MSLTSLVLRDAAARLVRHCPEAPVRVSYERETDAHTVCEAAHLAVAVMTEHGFLVAQPLAIDVVHNLPDKPHLLGTFNPKLEKIEILSYEDCAKRALTKPPFRVPMDLSMHRSFVVHEIAHTIAQQNFAISDPSVAAQEYIAYSVQLATMAPTLRETILARDQLDPFEDEFEITTVYLAFDPSSFAVKVYRHLTEVADAPSFYQQL